MKQQLVHNCYFLMMNGLLYGLRTGLLSNAEQNKLVFEAMRHICLKFKDGSVRTNYLAELSGIEAQATALLGKGMLHEGNTTIN